MATTYKILGQVATQAASNATVYTVPSATSTIVSTIFVCNRGLVDSTFRIAIVKSTESLSAKHYINYESPITSSSSLSITTGITMQSGDSIQVYANNQFLSFSIFGSEIS